MEVQGASLWWQWPSSTDPLSLGSTGSCTGCQEENLTVTKQKKDVNGKISRFPCIWERQSLGMQTAHIVVRVALPQVSLCVTRFPYL